MDRVMQEVWETTEHIKQSKQKDNAQLIHNDGHWIPVTLDDEDEEICLLGMDDNPQTYWEAMKAYDKPEWDQG